MEQKSSSFKCYNLEIQTHPEVYNPSEDTFLLLEEIDPSTEDSVFEIGSGTGIIALYCAQKGANVICSDINPFAIDLIKKNWEQNKNQLTGLLEIRKGSLFDVLTKDETFNLIIFNPPYLPTSKEEYVGGSGWFDKSVSGGKNGLKITKPFIQQLSKYLRDDGRAFTVFSSKSPRIEFNQIHKKNNLKSTIVSSQSFTDETLEVHKIIKK
ncbi:MAG: methyltransferase [Candidatus Thermoplasmatota archaeon]|nr:methyltransferase [Candidatus Thermoplasmatota archaeon]